MSFVTNLLGKLHFAGKTPHSEVVRMTSQVPREFNAIRSEDESFLRTIGGHRIALDECLSIEDVDSDGALDSIHRLIRTGYLCLVVSVRTWGLEFEIQRTLKGRRATRTIQ